MSRRKWLAICALVLVVMAVGSVLGGRNLREAYAEPDATYRELALFTDVLAIVRHSYVEEVPVKELVYGAINGMLATLDPHSSFMPPDMYKEMKSDTKGEFGGLGIEITIRDGVLVVVAPIEDTPAFRAGILAGDQILKIDGRLTKEMDVMEAVRLLRGAKGSTVTLTIARSAAEPPRDYTLTREIVKVKSVKAKTLDDGYAYVRLTQFQERSADDLEQALGRLTKENGGVIHGLILDMRNNPGGLLDQAVAVSDLFLSSGLIVYTEGREAGSKMQYSAHLKGTQPAYPMVVLINGGSASAAEIVAGALQDQQRAVIVGTQSFGKGSVQTIIPLNDDSGLRLTTARYFTPKGVSIQARGIAPDIVVDPVEIKSVAEIPQHFREQDLRNHFETPARAGAAGQSAPPTGDKFAPGEEERSDYQLMRALDLLKGLQILKGLQPAAA